LAGDIDAGQNKMQEMLSLIYTAVDQVNAQILDGAKIEKSPNTRLLDVDSGIDSLSLVNLVVALEQLIYDKTGKSITIADEKILSSPNNPFRTLGSLAAHLETLLK
jgi:acyl carrier protein